MTNDTPTERFDPTGKGSGDNPPAAGKPEDAHTEAISNADVGDGAPTEAFDHRSAGAATAPLGTGLYSATPFGADRLGATQPLGSTPPNDATQVLGANPPTGATQAFTPPTPAGGYGAAGFDTALFGASQGAQAAQPATAAVDAAPTPSHADEKSRGPLIALLIIGAVIAVAATMIIFTLVTRAAGPEVTPGPSVAPSSTPTPTPSSTPEPTPDPEPAPAPEPAPVPEPEPEPEPTETAPPAPPTETTPPTEPPATETPTEPPATEPPPGTDAEPLPLPIAPGGEETPG